MLVCFTGLPPVFFFFPKLSLLVSVLQSSTFLRVLLILLFLIVGWYAYFLVIRWFSLTQTVVGYSRALVDGLFSTKVVLLWVLFFFVLGGLGFFMDDFVVLTSWLFS